MLTPVLTPSLKKRRKRHSDLRIQPTDQNKNSPDHNLVLKAPKSEKISSIPGHTTSCPPKHRPASGSK